MGEDSTRPTSDDDREAWKAYWGAQGMPWRIEPEISVHRKEYLGERRGSVKPDIEKGVYPFKDIEPNLTRADVEWLLAAHKSNGILGPVTWNDAVEHRRTGLDLRGAQLEGEDLSDLPLVDVRLGLSLYELPLVDGARQLPSLDSIEAATAHLERATLHGAHLERAQCWGTHFERADLRGVYFRRAGLWSAHFQKADLGRAHLEDAFLQGANLSGANMQLVFFDAGTHLQNICLQTKEDGATQFRDMQWGNANLALIDWAQISMLGEEEVARRRTNPDGTPKVRKCRVVEYRTAARTNRQLATVLRGQGINEQADRFAHHALVMARKANFWEFSLLKWFGSLVLALVAGYGYKPLRSLITYLVVIGGFAFIYYHAARAVHVAMPLLAALVFSVTSFHGRGFMPSENVGLTNPLTEWAAVEAIIGLLIEIVFIATFTQRFFAR
jgi:hypothetical protein